MYDLIIIWGWASGLMCSIFAPKNISKVIIEKNQNCWTKILLSWWERCNFTNQNLDIYNHYFSNNIDKIDNVFSKFSNNDMIEFVEKNWIQYVVNDNFRVLLKSWNSKELLDILLKKSLENNTEILYWTNIVDINIITNWYEIIDSNMNKYITKNLVISTWWRSFLNTWTDWMGYNFAKKLWIETISPYKWLCSFITKTDYSQVAWISVLCEMDLVDNNMILWKEVWNLLFAHFWITWPAVYNMSLLVGSYLRSKKIDNSQIHNYLRNNLFLNVNIIDKTIPKRIKEFFKFKNNEFITQIKLDDWKSWKEAKVTGGGVSLEELNKNFESIKYKGLYFVWEIVDVTGKTWWYNLQFAWTSWYIAWKSIMNK